MTEIKIEFGYENFSNYRRLAYKWWYALAEFVDNSTQSYMDNQVDLDARLDEEQDLFKVTIATDHDFIRISDNAMGMNIGELRRALRVGVPPENAEGRCRYGLGMKTGACWIGNNWRIITSMLGDPNEYTVDVSVDEIARGNLDLPITSRTVESGEHYTVIEIRDFNRPLRGRTIGKVKDHLRSIYRQDITSGMMLLTYNDVELQWHKFEDSEFLARRDGTVYKANFIFEADTEPEKKVVEGWVGVLKSGSRSKAGFSILHRKRVIKGWPESWRPEKIFGPGGRNDLINQRLVGEVNLEDFEVSHTKDEINWHGDDEDKVEEALRAECKPFMDTASSARGGRAPGHGPDLVHVDAAIRQLEEELSTAEFLEKLTLEEALPPTEQIQITNHQVVENASKEEPSFIANLGEMTIKVFVDTIGSPNDPYFINENKDEKEVLAVINAQHPHWSMLEGENAIVNYLRHCVYDAVAEHRAARMSRLEPDSIKRLKDSYLRLSFELLQQTEDDVPEDV
jgi:hypothetical protein